MSEISTQVLIVGAGPVGLALAFELSSRGVHSIIIEQKIRAGAQPRAKTTNVRTMAHFRRWGLADAVRAASPIDADFPRRIIFATRLFGHKLACFPDAFFGDQHAHDDRFPEPAQWIPQYTIEAVLRKALEGRAESTTRFGHTLVGLRQNADGVDADVLHNGERQVIRARYVVGADGGRSSVRKAIGATMEGDYAYMRNFLAVYRAPGLGDRVPLGQAISYWLVNPESPAVTGPMDKGDIWFFSTQLKNDEPVYDLPEARRRIKLAIGEDVPFDILETDTWSAHRLLADRYRDGRIFLAGDACHLHPPMGGYGMNMGVGDAADLGWKLAAVVQGWGGDRLLDSYEAERRPVARLVIDEAAKNYGFVTHHMVRDQIEAGGVAGQSARETLGDAILAGKQREFRAIGVVLGLSYAGSPVVISDGTEILPWEPMNFKPDAQPGRLAPHCWLADGRSLYDVFGQGFTLIATTTQGVTSAAPLLAEAKRRGIPMLLADLTGEPGVNSLYGANLALIRPDQHVAWRGNIIDPSPQELLDRVSGLRTLASQEAAG